MPNRSALRPNAAGSVVATEMRLRNRGNVLLLSLILLLVSACGPTGEAAANNPSTGGGSSAAPTTATATTSATVDDVYAQLGTLSGDARTKKLIELANAEGTLSIYTSNAQMQDFSNAFQDEYKSDGLKLNVSDVIGPSNTVLARLLQEQQANFVGADVMELHAQQNVALTDQAVLAQMQGPIVTALPKDLDLGTWAVTRMDVYATAWNTNLVSKSDVPTSYADLADPKWCNHIEIDPRHFSWFETLWQYFKTELNWTDAQNQTYWETLAKCSSQIPDVATGVQLLATGDKSILVGAQYLEASQQRDKGAPIDLLPLLDPVVIEPTGVGILRNAHSPAAAVLFSEWFLTSAAPTLSKQYRVPPSDLGPGGPLGGAKYLVTDVKAISGDSGTTWSDKYTQLLQSK